MAAEKMTPEQFCYWLQGQFELKGGDTELGKDQIKMINNHLQTVFTKVTPKTPSRKGAIRHIPSSELIC